MALQLALFDQSELAPNLRVVGRAEVSRKSDSLMVRPASGFLKAFDFALNPYHGCAFGCTYCYAKHFVAEDEKKIGWGTWVSVKGALGPLEKLAGATIYVGSATDPYQPLEATEQITRRVLETLLQLRTPPLIVIQTRSPLVLRDADLLSQFPHRRVNLSITTDSESVRREFEASCPSIFRRMEAAERLVELGIPVGICVAPMLPIQDPVRFASTLRGLRAQRYGLSWFHRDRGTFAAGTDRAVMERLREIGWTELEFQRASRILRVELPLMAKGNVFDPE